MTETAHQKRLIQQAQAGDPNAFTELLQLHDKQMRSLAYNLLQSATAMDDALQDAYLKAYKGLGGFRQDASFGTWLHRIVHNACIDHLKRSSRRAEVSLEAVADQADTGTAFDQRIAHNNQMQQILTTLPHDQRAALLLVDGEGYSYGQAAYVLETNAGTIASRLNRARTTVRAALETNR